MHLPIETVIQIADLPNESESTKPPDVEKHREVYRVLIALRLTCNELEAIATRQLFRTFRHSPSFESWVKLHSIATSQKLRLLLRTIEQEGRTVVSFKRVYLGTFLSLLVGRKGVFERLGPRTHV